MSTKPKARVSLMDQLLPLLRRLDSTNPKERKMAVEQIRKLVGIAQKLPELTITAPRSWAFRNIDDDLSRLTNPGTRKVRVFACGESEFPDHSGKMSPGVYIDVQRPPYSLKPYDGPFWRYNLSDLQALYYNSAE